MSRALGTGKRTALDRYKAWLIEVTGACSVESEWYGRIDLCVALMHHVNALLLHCTCILSAFMDPCERIIQLRIKAQSTDVQLKLDPRQFTLLNVCRAAARIKASSAVTALPCCSDTQLPIRCRGLTDKGGKGSLSMAYPIRGGGREGCLQATVGLRWLSG